MQFNIPLVVFVAFTNNISRRKEFCRGATSVPQMQLEARKKVTPLIK